MPILVVGSVAFDTIRTPHGSVDHCLGGAATHFALAASFFTPVRIIGVVGEDYTEKEESVLHARGIDTRGIERLPGKCFHWTGEYHGAMNEAHTLQTDLNVLQSFQPKIPAVYQDSEFLFLANMDPALQHKVRTAMPDAKMVCGDTMNYWITGHRANLDTMLRGLDVLLVNDGEARLLSGETNLLRAAERILASGPKTLIVKHGEYGATAFFGSASFPGDPRHRFFHAPALPLSEVVDPTGAGDSFAGGFFGYLASQPAVTPAAFRRAMFYGGVMGSFAVERFGTERIQSLTREEIDRRFAMFRELSHLDTD